MAPQVNAATTLDFGTLVKSGGDLQPVSTFATLVVSVDSTSRVWDYSLRAYDLNTLFTPGAWLDTLHVSLDKDIPQTLSNVVGDSPISLPGGNWDTRYYLWEGGASNRLTSNESVSWRITYGTPVHFDISKIILEADGFDTTQPGKSGGGFYAVSRMYESTATAPVTTPVPEPESFGMLIAGLALITVLAKRKIG